MDTVRAPESIKYGQRLLPILVDEIALSDPDRVFVSFPSTDGTDTKYQDVNFASLARAINRCSWWLEENIGRSESFETLSYMGPQDLRLIVLVFAAIKIGHKVSYTSDKRCQSSGHESYSSACRV